MKFEWDEDKNQANIRKHKISFEVAIHISMTLIILKCMTSNIVLMKIGTL